jgi:hypothetical protein
MLSKAPHQEELTLQSASLRRRLEIAADIANWQLRRVLQSSCVSGLFVFSIQAFLTTPQITVRQSSSSLHLYINHASLGFQTPDQWSNPRHVEPGT